MRIARDKNGVVVQGFNPSPTKTINASVANGSDVTIDTTDDLAVYLYASGDLSLKLGSAPQVFPLPAGVPFGFVCIDIDSITLVNTTGGEVSLYVLRQ